MRLSFVLHSSNQGRQSCKKYSNHPILASKYCYKLGNDINAEMILLGPQATLPQGNAGK
jgi:hypothetical protein